MEIEKMKPSVTLYNRLKGAGIDTVEKLASMKDEELLNIRGFGKKCLEEAHRIVCVWNLDFCHNVNRGKALEILKDPDLIYCLENRLEFFHEGFGAALELAIFALEFPEKMCCGGCEFFCDEDAEGRGWCYHHDRYAECDDRVCMKGFEKRGTEVEDM